MDTPSPTHASPKPAFPTHSSAAHPGAAYPRPARVEPMERRLLMSHTVSPFTHLADGDFNGDGAAESLVRISARRPRLADFGLAGPGMGAGFGAGAGFRRGSLLLLDGSGALLGDPLGIQARGRNTPLVATGDFNGDGRLDLVLGGNVHGAGLGSRLGANRGLTLLAGNGDGTFQRGVPIGQTPTNVTSLVVADVNNDGRSDLLGTARVRRFAPAADRLNRAIREEYLDDRPNDNDGGVARELPVDIGLTRPHLVGASAEAGGGVVDFATAGLVGTGGGTVSTTTLSPDLLAGGSQQALPSVPPGFTPVASRVGATAEAGGARIPEFAEFFADGEVIEDNEQVFVLLNSGNGTFTRVEDIGGGNNNGNNNGSNNGGSNNN